MPGHRDLGITPQMKQYQKTEVVYKEFPNFDVLGFVDALHDGIIYEFKTTATLPDAPQTAHVLQAQAYFSLLPEPQKSAVTSIQIIYLSMHSIKVFEIPIRDITSFLEARAMQLTLALKNKLPVEKEVSWLCKYCDFYQKCFSDKPKFID